MSTNREFTELLKGVRPVVDNDGNVVVQSIMNMELVCLTTDDEYSLDDKFANPLEVLNTSNRNYGHLNITNKNSKPTIAPTQMAVMTEQHAQNHGMVKAAYISGNASNDYNDAGCVQGNQTGLINNSSEFRFIPVTMREMCFEKVGETGNHANIYDAIDKMGRETKSNAGHYLNVYFEKYDKKLEQFIAHFERPEKMIGVMVLIDGEIVAIDKYPSFTYAEQVWDLLIRDCYGALAIMSELENKTSNTHFTDTLNGMGSTNGGSTLERLESALLATKKSMTKSVKEKIEDLLDLDFTTELDVESNDSNSKVESFVVKHEGYIGQLISESNYHHLVSLVKRDRFDPKALRRVSEMKRKARGQNKFSI